MKKKLLFVINTLGYGGAERAMIDLFEVLGPEKYEISLFVLTGQGELSHALPKYVHLLNPDYQDVSVLTDEGKKASGKECAKSRSRKRTVSAKGPLFVEESLEYGKKREDSSG